LASSTCYIYDGWRVIQERDGDNTPAVSYTRGTDLSGTLEGAGGIGGLLARSHGYSGGNWSTHNFYHADGNGNVTCLVTSAQGLAASYRYDPYGNIISQSGSLTNDNVYRFSSKEFHAQTGLYYYGYRFYAPNLQRWLTTDPIDEKGFVVVREAAVEIPRGRDLRRIQTHSNQPNLFIFNQNNAIEHTDGLGLYTWTQTEPCLSFFCVGYCTITWKSPNVIPAHPFLLAACAAEAQATLSTACLFCCRSLYKKACDELERCFQLYW
jgi:RHS repeat-associated protein